MYKAGTLLSELVRSMHKRGADLFVCCAGTRCTELCMPTWGQRTSLRCQRLNRYILQINCVDSKGHLQKVRVNILSVSCNSCTRKPESLSLNSFETISPDCKIN